MATNRDKNKRVPPSRRKYEEDHPVVSVRIPKEMSEELQLLKSASGMSVAEVLRVGLDKAMPALEEAFNRGCDDAEGRFKVIYLCSGCGEQTLSIGTREQKEAAAELMYQDGWYCPECL